MYFSAYYICNEMKDVSRIRRRTSFLSVYFFLTSTRRLQPCRHCARGCGCLIFCGEKRKKEKERNGAEVSLKKERYFSRFNFCYLDCRSLKCDFGKASLPKMIYQKFSAGKVLVLLRAVHNVTAAKSVYLYETPWRAALKSAYLYKTPGFS